MFRPFPRWLRLLSGLLFLFTAVFVSGAAAIAVDGMNDQLFRADVGVVLGNEVYRSGKASPRLAARLDRALLLYREGYFPRIIVSGGRGLSGWDEAEVMRDYLVQRGVPDEAIIVDSSGINTRETARFTAGWLAQNGRNSAIAVSQFFHLARCRLAFRQAGIAQAGTASAHYHEGRDCLSLGREVFGYVAYFLGLK